jgi:hypothetical protein
MSYNPYEPNHDPYQTPPPQFPPQPYSPDPDPLYPPQTYLPPSPAQPFAPPPPGLHGHYQPHPGHLRHHQPPPGFHGHYRPHPVFGYQQPMFAPASGWATASLVLGVVGILVGWCLAGIPSLIAIVAGHIGLAETNSGTRSGRGLAIAGLTLGYLAVIPGVILFFLTVVGTLNGASTP